VLKPSLFIGSSTPGLEYASAIRYWLEADVEVTVWNDGAFSLGTTLIEGLISAVQRYDFAALVLTPDDLLAQGDIQTMGPRDNVIFELGLFMGRLGRDRTFMVRPANTDLKIPSDLAGVLSATYQWPRADNNYRSAVASACTRIKEQIRNLGLSRNRTLAHIEAVEAEQQRQKGEIDALSFVIAHLLPFFEIEHLIKLQNGQEFLYDMHPGFERELRHLLALGFISKKFAFGIAGMHRQGNLSDYFAITEQGRTYLALRAQTRATQPDRTEESSG
jgi:hypothetical protein